MPCSIYCLVTRFEDVQPAIEKLTSAGVPSDAVTVVFRAGEAWLSRSAGEVSSIAHRTLWNVPFASMSLWWSLATLGFGAPPSEASRPKPGAARVVVPPAVFEARRQLRQRGVG